jgi:CheY-like chemotaxis protein
MNDLSNKKILVVDDDGDTRELLRFTLEQYGADVVLAQSVDAALKNYREAPPHAVVADIRLGISDGYALIQMIRENDIEYRGFTPAIAVTGFASREDEERAMMAGFNAYLAKPFDPEELVTTIASLLSGSGHQAA